MDYVANLLDESSSFSIRGEINLFITNKNKNPVGYSKLGRYYGTHSWQSKQKKNMKNVTSCNYFGVSVLTSGI